jgi:hypothetical protein
MVMIRCGCRAAARLGAAALVASVLGSGAMPPVWGEDSTRANVPVPRILCAFDTEEDIKAWRVEDPYKPQPGRLEFAFIRTAEGRLPWVDGPFGGSELGNCIYCATTVAWTGWREVKMPVAAFQQRSGRGGNVKPKWTDVGSLVLCDATRKGLDIRIDSLRMIEAPEKK